MHTNQRGFRRLALAALIPLAVVSACGSDEDSASSSPPVSAAATTTAAAETTAASTAEPASSAAPDATTAASTADTTPATEAASMTTCPGVTASTDPQPLPERTKVVLSSAGLLEAFAPVFVAKADGEFEKENLDVEIITTQTAVQSLATGEIDGAFTAPSIEMINAVNQDVNLKWVAGNYTAIPDTKIGVYARADVVGDGDFTKLKGTKLGMAGPTGITLVSVNGLLQESGLSLADVEVTKLAPADSLIALENGAIAAAWLNAPINREVVDDPNYVFLGGQNTEMVGGGFVIGDRLLDPDNCQITVAIVRAMQRVIDTKLAPGYHDDPAVVGQLAELFQAPAEAITASEELLFNQRIPEFVIPTFEDTLVEAGLIAEADRADPADLVDRSFVDDVLGQG